MSSTFDGYDIGHASRMWAPLTDNARANEFSCHVAKIQLVSTWTGGSDGGEAIEKSCLRPTR